MAKSNVITVSLKNASTTNNGCFEGWGTSLCWWANRVGYSPELTEKCAELFFGDSGLRLNIMRYNIGGGDNPEHKHITRTDSMVPGWLIYNKVTKTYEYDYNADSNQLNVLKKAYEKAGKDALVEVFSNSPPYFMTKSGCSSGGENPVKNNLKDECYSDFVEYLAHVTQYINNSGIRVSSLSPMNEPNTNYWSAYSEKQEGCHFDAGKSQNKILIEAAKAIKSKGLTNVQIIGSDETSTSRQLTAYNKYTDEAKAVIDRISTHTYGTRNIKKLGALMKSENRNLWMSETDWSGYSGKNAGEMGAGLWLAEKIIYDINGLSPSAWVIWQTIDYHISQKGYMGNKDFGMPDISKGFWGVAVADHDKKEVILTQKYYSWGQFTRYIRPNDTIIHCNDKVLAAYNKQSGKIVIVAVNSASKQKNCTFSFEGFSEIGKTAKVIRTSGNSINGEKWKKLGTADITDYELNVQLKSNSITTFVIE